MMNLLSIVVVSGLIASAGIAGDVVNVDKFIKNGVMMFSDTSRGKTFAKDPAVVRFKDK